MTAAAPFPLEDSLPYLLSRAALAANGDLERAMRRLGAEGAAWRALLALDGRDGFTVTGLGRAALVAQATMSKALTRMLAADLVRLAPDGARLADRRATFVSITEAGRRLAGAVAAEAAAHEAAFLAHHPGFGAPEVRAALAGVGELPL